MDGNFAPGQIYGLFNYCQYKIGTPKEVVSKKKGLISIRSGFGVIHRPQNAKISAITQVLTFFFFFVLETTPLGLPDFRSKSRDKP